MATQLSFDWREIERARYEPRVIYDHPRESELATMPEGQFFERKGARTDPKDVAKALCAFSNSDARGGVLVVGVHGGKVEGLDRVGERRVNELLDAARQFCPDAICQAKTARLAEKTVVLYLVEYNASRVVTLTDGSVWLRSGDKTRELRPEEIQRLRQDKGEVPFEFEFAAATWDDLDPSLVHEFAESVRMADDLRHDRSDADILVQRRLGAMRDGRFVPRNAAFLLFAKDPIPLFPGCKVRFIRHEGSEERTGKELNVVKDVVIEGPVPRLIQRAAEVVFSQLREFSALQADGKFRIVPEYPPDCVMEAIVNACVHRSYGIRNANVFVRMFDNRLEVESPGGFVPPVTAENIYEQHVPRNPILMDALRYMRFVRCANEGTRRMRQQMQSSGLPLPEFQQESDRLSLVRVRLKNNVEQRRTWIDKDLTRLVGESLAQSLTSDEKRVLNYLAENQRMNVSDALRVTNARKWHSARRIMDKLLEKKLVVERKSRPRDPNAFFELSEALRPNGSH
jgi:ATP-dependent DNA helicase RecG